MAYGIYYLLRALRISDERDAELKDVTLRICKHPYFCIYFCCNHLKCQVILVKDVFLF